MSNLLGRTISVGAVKGISALIGFGLTVFVSHILPADEAGLFLLGLTLSIALSGFFRLGLDNVVLRIMGSHGVNNYSFEKLNRGVLWVSLAVIPFSIAGIIFSSEISVYIFNKPELASVLKWVFFALPAITIFTLISMAFQGLHKTITSIVFQNLGISILFVFISVLIWVFDLYLLDSDVLTFIYAMCALVIFFIAYLAWKLSVGYSFRMIELPDKDLWIASSNLWVATCMILLVQWVGILIAGSYLEAQDLAYLLAAQRTANLTSFVLLVVNMVVAPRYAKLWHEGKTGEIQKLAKWSTRAMLALAIPVVSLMIILPEFVMRLFGEGYEEGAILLAIMAVGQFVNVATGSVGYLLNMSGHERDFRRVTFFAGPLAIVLSFILIPEYGAKGAAMATAVGLSVQNIGALFMVRRRLGFWPLG